MEDSGKVSSDGQFCLANKKTYTAMPRTWILDMLEIPDVCQEARKGTINCVISMLASLQRG